MTDAGPDAAGGRSRTDADSRRDDAGLRRVVRFVEDEVDFEPGYYNDAYIARRIAARMRRRSVDSYAAYLRVLGRDDAERDALLDALTVNVTGFFRNPEVWEALRPVVRDLTDAGRTRCWSAPCADGREPYSLAMLLRDDPEVVSRRASVLATDISASTLARARRGTYETTRTTDIGDELAPLSSYEPYVEREGDRFTVRERVKRLVEFERHDLIRDDPGRGFDLVLCRNLLIYIDAAHKEAMVETVADSLRSGGYLVVGKTETVPTACRESFDPVDDRCRIYRKV